MTKRPEEPTPAEPAGDDESIEPAVPGDIVDQSDEAPDPEPDAGSEDETQSEPERVAEAEADVTSETEAEPETEPESEDELEAETEDEEPEAAVDPGDAVEADAPDDVPIDAFEADDAEDGPIDEAPVDEEDAVDEEDGGSHRGRYVVLGVLGLLAAAYVAGYFLTGTRMPAHATIGGVDVSGISPTEARGLVDKALTPHTDDQIVLVHDKKEFRIKPADAGLAFNLDRSIAEAGGNRSWSPSDMIGLFFGEHDTAPALDVDNSKLQSVIGTIGEAVNVEVIEAQITFPKAKPTPRQPVAGLVVARDDAADAIEGAYLVTDDEVTVPTVVVEPAVDSEGLAEAMKTIAEPAVSAPVILAVGDKDVSLPVTAYAPALVIRVEDNQLKPYIDPKKLAGPLTDSVTGIGKKAVDATVRIENGKPVVVPGKEGVGLQPEEMAEKLVPVIDKTGDDRTIEIEAKVVDPLFTTKDAKALKITERISSFKTEFPYAQYRNVNQGRAAKLLNGTIVKPGETFSFNDTVGERTVANGFTTGTVINGGVFREELGGGVSQVVTTTYNAAFFGGMDDVEHHPHAFYINRYPVGREATVYYGSLDLRWKNSTKYGVLIRAWVNPSTPNSAGQMHVELWSTKVYDVKAGQSARRNFRSPGTQYDATNRCVPQGPIQGFDIDIYRTFYQGGKKVKSETDTARYQAADTVICGKKPE